MIKVIKDQYIRLHVYSKGKSSIPLKMETQNKMIQRIQDGFRNLEFLEEKEILSIDQLKKESNGIKQNYRSCMIKLNELVQKINQLENLRKIPEKIQTLQKHIEEHAADEVYQKTEMDIDIGLLRNYKAMLEEFDMKNSGGNQNLEQGILILQEKIKKLFLLRDYYEVEIKRYEACQKIFQDIDREKGNDRRKR